MQEETCQAEKKPYVKPQLVTHGDVAELTQHKGGPGDDGRDRGPASHLF